MILEMSFLKDDIQKYMRAKTESCGNKLVFPQKRTLYFLIPKSCCCVIFF